MSLAVDCLLPREEVQRQTGLSKASLYRLITKGRFPKQTHVGTSARWSQLAVQAWIAQQFETPAPSTISARDIRSRPRSKHDLAPPSSRAAEPSPKDVRHRRTA